MTSDILFLRSGCCTHAWLAFADVRARLLPACAFLLPAQAGGLCKLQRLYGATQCRARQIVEKALSHAPSMAWQNQGGHPVAAAGGTP